jgi:hypothetical protein
MPNTSLAWLSTMSRITSAAFAFAPEDRVEPELIRPYCGLRPEAWVIAARRVRPVGHGLPVGSAPAHRIARVTPAAISNP